jgi:hypothetical protein
VWGEVTALSKHLSARFLPVRVLQLWRLCSLEQVRAHNDQIVKVLVGHQAACQEVVLGVHDHRDARRAGPTGGQCDDAARGHNLPGTLGDQLDKEQGVVVDPSEVNWFHCLTLSVIRAGYAMMAHCIFSGLAAVDQECNKWL